MYLNFSQVGSESLFIYYPVILISISVALLFNPLKMFYFRTRMWLLYSLVSDSATAEATHTDTRPVALVTRRHLPCGVARLLPRRHVLFIDIHLGCRYPGLPLQCALTQSEHGHILLSLFSRMEQPWFLQLLASARCWLHDCSTRDMACFTMSSPIRRH